MPYQGIPVQLCTTLFCLSMHRAGSGKCVHLVGHVLETLPRFHTVDCHLCTGPLKQTLPPHVRSCDVDCSDDPTKCISEQLYMDMADSMVQYGYADAGYEYVLIDE